MTINISSYESDLYSVHYGAGQGEALRIGEGFSPATIMHGKIRNITDEITLDDSTPLFSNQVIFFPGFSQDCFIVEAKVAVVAGSDVATTLSLSVFSNNTPQGILVEDVIDNIDAFSIGAHVDMANDNIRIPAAKGSFLGLKNTDASISAGHFQVVVLYTSSE